MKCACCGKYIREAYYHQAGRTYGPTCGKRLGLDIGLDVKLWNSPITKYKFKKAVQQKVVVQDGQGSLFLEIS